MAWFTQSIQKCVNRSYGSLHFPTCCFHCFPVWGKNVIVTPTVTATTITITGSVPSGSVVTWFVVEWQRDTSVGCSDEDEDSITVNGAFLHNNWTGARQ